MSITIRENTKQLPGIPLSMRAWSILLAVLVLCSCVFAAEGMFQGEIVEPPSQKPSVPGWIFVQSRNRMVRRVDVAHAVIVAAAGASSGQARKCGPECLAVGQEVRVTAEQDGSGEWHARRVEILHPTSDKGSTISPSIKLRVSAFGLKLDAGISPSGLDPAGPACPYETLPWPPSQDRGCWITTPIRLCIQPLTEKSIITRWSGGIMNDVL